MRINLIHSLLYLKWWANKLIVYDRYSLFWACSLGCYQWCSWLLGRMWMHSWSCHTSLICNFKVFFGCILILLDQGLILKKCRCCFVYDSELFINILINRFNPSSASNLLCFKLILWIIWVKIGSFCSWSRIFIDDVNIHKVLAEVFSLIIAAFHWILSIFVILALTWCVFIKLNGSSSWSLWCSMIIALKRAIDWELFNNACFGFTYVGVCIGWCFWLLQATSLSNRTKASIWNCFGVRRSHAKFAWL